MNRCHASFGTIDSDEFDDELQNANAAPSTYCNCFPCASSSRNIRNSTELSRLVVECDDDETPFEDCDDAYDHDTTLLMKRSNNSMSLKHCLLLLITIIAATTATGVMAFRSLESATLTPTTATPTLKNANQSGLTLAKLMHNGDHHHDEDNPTHKDNNYDNREASFYVQTRVPRRKLWTLIFVCCDADNNTVSKPKPNPININHNNSFVREVSTNCRYLHALFECLDHFNIRVIPERGGEHLSAFAPPQQRSAKR
jgi:hypothetical protein